MSDKEIMNTCKNKREVMKYYTESKIFQIFKMFKIFIYFDGLIKLAGSLKTNFPFGHNLYIITFKSIH